MKFRSLFPFALCALAAAAASAAPAATDPPRLIPFNEFRDSLRSADSAAYIHRAEARVADAAAFEAMRQHLLSLYEGEHVSNSFETGGDILDCVPILEQPALRLNGITEVATPPEPTRMDAGDPREAAESIVPWDVTEKDAFGNPRSCANGTVPIRRVTLEEITRFRSLAAFLHKSPDGEEIVPGVHPEVAVTHKYSHALENVANWGGNGYLNVWDPAINTAAGEIFSLTQHWYVGGSGTTLPGLQTVELGWQVFPAKYGNTNPHLFVYYTADGYNHTGCYNHDCAAFVQVSSTVTPGNNLSPFSHTGSTQYEIQLQAKLTGGNWWVFYGGSAVGYYPTSLYHGGQLTKHATVADYGTESTGTTVWPPEGSGAWPSGGWEKAAYIRDLYYTPTATATTGTWLTLTRQLPNPNCYTVAGPTYSSSSGWGIYFYDGGPGGGSC